jgi:glycerophosphoryl diester phosphodiesterase
LNGQIPIQLLTSEIIRNPNQYLADYGTRFINPKYSAWSPQQIKELSAEGIAFTVWTVNDELTMKALINSNVNGIITDFPQILIPLLEGK